MRAYRWALMALALMVSGCGDDGPSPRADLTLDGGEGIDRALREPDGPGQWDVRILDVGPVAEDALAPEDRPADLADEGDADGGMRDIPEPAADADGAVPGDLTVDGTVAMDALLKDGQPDAPPGTGLSVRVVAPQGESGTVILELTPAQGGPAQRFTAQIGDTLDLPDLADGPYGLRAWLDQDDDATWDGIWEGEGEATAVMGLTLPRQGLTVALRRGWPHPILDDSPQWLELYDRAWELARDHIAAGTGANGLADHYMDEAFSDQIFQWDTCFMALFGRYGLDAFPVMASLDNFYGAQGEDGYICRVVNESDGRPGGDASDPSEPMINPPLFAWVEALYAHQTGDLSRLSRVLPVLEAYDGWIDGHVRTATGLYYTSMLGSGMDNAPREAAYDGWVDISAQQALAKRSVALLAELQGYSSLATASQAAAESLCQHIRDMMWDDTAGFFFDLGQNGMLLQDKTLASIWPLLAGCATADQAARVVDHLRDPSAFWRVNLFPSTAADSPAYDPQGHYWRGGVWAPTTYATIVALAGLGEHDLARAASAGHLTSLYRVYADFEPRPDQLSPEETGHGRRTLWELYAPDSHQPGTRWDNTYLGRQDFVGWTGLGPIALLLEQVIGLEARSTEDTLVWRITRTDRHGVEGYRFGDQLVDLVVEGRGDSREGVNINIESSDAFTLAVEMAGRRWTFRVPEGSSAFSVDPSESDLPAAVVPQGPFPGYAVVGNGNIAAVVSDDDGSGDPPGLVHLYAGHFGLDLVEAGRTQVVRGGSLIGGARVGLDPFFAAFARRNLPDNGLVAWRTFVGEESAVVVQGTVRGGDVAQDLRVVPHVRLRPSPHMDGTVTLVGVSLDGAALVAELSDGTALAMGASPAPLAWQSGEIDQDRVVAGLNGRVAGGPELALEIALTVAAGEVTPFVWVLAVGQGRAEALATLHSLLARPDPLEEARAHWQGWSPDHICGGGDLCRLAAANLYAARSSILGGRVPADLTGQFVTNGFPQIYPRDALMVARALSLAGHDEEAWEIVHDWLSGHYEGPAPGEWYARYDALGRAVDGGSGAAYDVPEWDANGYLAVLVERLGPEELTPVERETLLLALDLLVDRQDGEGLYEEGGIVEWVGRLAATAMTSWAGLDAGARLAEGWGQAERAREYRGAAGRIRGGLLRLFDHRRLILADERDQALAYNTSLLFGPAWGYPAGPLLDQTQGWILDNATAHGGGVRYFEGMGYGQDLFFFTTSAAAEYGAAVGDHRTADDLLAWMAAFTNRYGLAPERVYADGSGAAEASPLSWCAAELAVAVLLGQDGQAEPPVVDGEVTSKEYRPWGPAVVDGDGAPDLDGHMVALFGARHEGYLTLGLMLAGQIDHLGAGSRYLLYLANGEGTGEVHATAGGQALTFRCAPEMVPGAVTSIVMDPLANTCTMGQAGDCPSWAAGQRSLEVEVDLAALGLDGPVQIIAVAEGAEGESLLPAHGSLLTGGEEENGLVTFEVDATSVAGQLNPAAGVVVTLSGDRVELGQWVGHAVALVDDGTRGDRVAQDNVWATTVRLEGGMVQYKYLVGVVGDESWEGVEFEGDNRSLYGNDIDGTGRVRVLDSFGLRGGVMIDP